MDWLVAPKSRVRRSTGRAQLARVEVFVTDGTNVLQLTDFRRTETASWQPFFSPRDGRVYFTASADPLGTNRRTTVRSSRWIR